MKIESFLAHHGLTQNPFEAEEARHDPVFGRLCQSDTSHPDFHKVLGQIDRPSTAVVFGEKGTGKTAIRLLIGKRVAEHNAQCTDHRTLLVAYDDLNPVLDRLIERHRQRMGAHRAARTSVEKILDTVRLEDHQDAILSLAVTRLVDGLLDEGSTSSDQSVLVPEKIGKRLKKLPRPQRVDIAVLAALYDQPRSGSVLHRWQRLRSRLKLGWIAPIAIQRLLAIMAGVVAAGLVISKYLFYSDSKWMLPLAGVALVGAVVLLAAWAWRHFKLWRLCRKVHREMLSVPRSVADLRLMLMHMRPADLVNHPWPVSGSKSIEGPGRHDPVAGNQDNRYQLTDRLLCILESLGYVGMMVLVDRVDEPAAVSGQPDRMRSIIWPMLDNKYLQQRGVGFKLLLPIELRHLLHRESTSFFQEARMDKQNMIDRLSWSGATLYDLCTSRLRACQNQQESALTEGEDDYQAVDAQENHAADHLGVPAPTPADGASTAPTDAEADGQESSFAAFSERAGGSIAKTIGLADLFDDEVTHDMLVDALDQMHQPRDAFKFLYNVLQEHCLTVPDERACYKIPRLTLDSVRRQQSQRVQELYRGLAPA